MTPRQTSIIDLLRKPSFYENKFKHLAIFGKRFIIDIWQDPKYTFAFSFYFKGFTKVTWCLLSLIETTVAGCVMRPAYQCARKADL